MKCSESADGDPTARTIMIHYPYTGLNRPWMAVRPMDVYVNARGAPWPDHVNIGHIPPQSMVSAQLLQQSAVTVIIAIAVVITGEMTLSVCLSVCAMCCTVQRGAVHALRYVEQHKGKSEREEDEGERKRERTRASAAVVVLVDSTRLRIMNTVIIS